jgi:pimeloyl-ACP methyl ester carboxylesterase
LNSKCGYNVDGIIHSFTVGIDSCGHGKSSLGARKLSYELLTDDLAQVIDSLQLQEFSMLGFRDGGIVAYRYPEHDFDRLAKPL